MKDIALIRKQLIELEYEAMILGADFSNIITKAKNNIALFSGLQFTITYSSFEKLYQEFQNGFFEPKTILKPTKRNLLLTKLLSFNQVLDYWIQRDITTIKQVRIVLAAKFEKAQLKGNKEELISLEKDLQSRIVNGSYPESYNILLTEIRRAISELPTGKPQQFEFENNTGFIHLPPQKIYDFFKEKLVDSNYLDLETLHKYLKAAFIDCTPPKEKFSIIKQGLTKGRVKKVWVDFSTTTQGVNSVQKRLKPKFVKLLSDYFEGFDYKSNYDNWRYNMYQNNAINT